jgi:outer membrane protein TolC
MKVTLKIVCLWIFLIPTALKSQQITLEDCWQKTRDHYPLNEKSMQVIEETTRQKLLNIKTAWLPQFELGAQATWQNDVPHMPNTGFIPDLPTAPKDQYKMGVEVSQTIYDGLHSKARSQQERATGSVEKQNIEIQLREVNLLVTDIYFTLLMLKEQKEQLNYLLEDMQVRLNELAAAVKSGVVLATERQLVEVEQLKLEKQLIAIDAQQIALYQSLSLFTGMEILPGASIQYPDESALQQPVLRPEYDLFRFQNERVESDRRLNKVTRRPVVAAFGQLGYGNPGFNMLQDEFDTYYMVGIRLRWKPWDWNASRRNSLSLDNQSMLIHMRQQAFELEQNRATLQLDGALLQHQQKIEKDARIVELQAAIVQNYRARLKYGTVTAADYIAVLNGESRARLEMQITKLNYLQNLTRKYLTAGK